MKTKFNILLIPIALFCSCSAKQAKVKVEQSIPASIPKSVNNNLFDSVDFNSYVGFINRYCFQKTDEFFVDLYFKQDDIDENDFTRIASSGDSTIYKDDEYHRSRIPLKIAIHEFDFRGLKTLSLFDENNRFLTKAHFLRVEYLDQNIAPVFTAVYKADKTSLTDKAVYCIGNLKDRIVTDKYISFDDTCLTNEIAQKLSYTHEYTLDGKHYHAKDNISISVINFDTTVVIVEKKNNSYDCLYQSKVSENMLDIVFVPLIRNSRPLILTKSIVPDTDVEWSDLLIFDGKRYQTSDRQRIIK